MTLKKSLYNIVIENCSINTRLYYNTNTDHIGIGTSHIYQNSDKNKEYYKNNKDKINKYHKEYRKNNKDKTKQYYKNNKEKFKDRIKQYYKDNKNKIKQYQKDNQDKIKQYYEDNKDLNVLKMGSKEHSIMLSCTKQKISIEEFNGFLTEQKYCSKFNKSLKTKIRNKYNNCDYITGLHTSICNKNRNLDVHHVDYNKNQGCNNTEWFLIPLSKSNHSKTNINRSFWNRLFKYSLEYDKEYYNNNEINIWEMI